MAQEGNGPLDGGLDGHAGQKPTADDPDKFVDDALSAPGFEMTGKGLYWKPGGDKPSMWLSGPFEVIGETRDAHNRDWGLWLRWQDDDRAWHECLVLWAPLLSGNREEIWRELADGGLRLATLSGARERLANYLATRRPERRIRTVPQIGWHVTNAVAAFVLPDKTFGETVAERVRWKTARRADTPYQAAGDLVRWREEISLRCVGNSRLVFGVSTAFAAPLLYPAGDRSGGVHFHGASQIGKTTIQDVAGSVCGGGRITGYNETWRATANGIEGLAALHCDTLFSLDEMGQVEPHEAGMIVYTLANGSAKGRARRDGSPRVAAQWRIMIMSSGEITLADKMEEVGKRRHAGQEVRLADIPADAGAGKGAFEELHGEASAATFADRLRELSAKNYGHPLREYLEQLIRQYGDARLKALTKLIGDRQNEFLAGHLPSGASGQVTSVCRRFALIAAGGRFATEFGLTGWKADEAERAAAKCFDAWLERRGTAGEQEVETGIRQVRAYLEAHGSSRFEAAWEPDTDSYRSRPIERTANRVGFRKRSAEGLWEYFVTSEQWRNEVAKGHDASALARAMIERGLMAGGVDGKSSVSMKVPGLGSTRLYMLTPTLLNGA